MTPPKRKIPKWVWGAIGSCLLVGWIAFGVFTTVQVMTDRVNRVFSEIGLDLSVIEEIRPINTTGLFYRSLIDHDYDSAHSLLGQPLAAQYTPMDLRTQWEALERGRGDIRLQLDLYSPREEGPKAFVDLSLVPTKGDHYDLTLQLEKSGDSWRITGASPGLIPKP